MIITRDTVDRRFDRTAHQAFSHAAVSTALRIAHDVEAANDLVSTIEELRVKNSNKSKALYFILNWLIELGYIRRGDTANYLVSLPFTWFRKGVGHALYELQVDDTGWYIYVRSDPSQSGATYKIEVDDGSANPQGLSLLVSFRLMDIAIGLRRFCGERGLALPSIDGL